MQKQQVTPEALFAGIMECHRKLELQAQQLFVTAGILEYILEKLGNFETSEGVHPLAVDGEDLANFMDARLKEAQEQMEQMMAQRLEQVGGKPSLQLDE